MAERGSKKYTAGEALEAIFADEDSGDENFDCGSDVEYVLDSENESESGESDLGDSLALPSTSYSLNKEKFQKLLQVMFITFISELYFVFNKIKSLVI